MKISTQFQISLKVNRLYPRFGAYLGLKYSRLPKFIQKIDPNARMPRIFMDSLDKSAFYIIYMFSRNIFIRLDAV